MKSSETASAPRKGYAIFIDTVCDGSTPVARGEEGEIVIFETEIEAQREVADHQMTRLQEFLVIKGHTSSPRRPSQWVRFIGVLEDGECRAGRGAPWRATRR